MKNQKFSYASCENLFQLPTTVRLEILHHLNLTREPNLAQYCLTGIEIIADITLVFSNENFGLHTTRRKNISYYTKIIKLLDSYIYILDNIPPTGLAGFLSFRPDFEEICPKGSTIASYLAGKKRELLQEREAVFKAKSFLTLNPNKGGRPSEIIRNKFICFLAIIFDQYHQWGFLPKRPPFIKRGRFNFIKAVLLEVTKQSKGTFWTPTDVKLKRLIPPSPSKPIANDKTSYGFVVGLIKIFIHQNQKVTGYQLGNVLIKRYAPLAANAGHQKVCQKPA